MKKRIENENSVGRHLGQTIRISKSMIKIKHIILFLILTLSISCDKDEITISREADDFLTEVLNTMENHSIKKNEIDWSDFRDRVYERAGTAQKVEETYEAIQLALTLLDDNHSFLVKPDGSWLRGTTDISCTIEDFNRPNLPDHIGYIAIRISSGLSNDEQKTYAENIQMAIKNEDNADLLGWIVDLRGSGGGNMYPALAGIGPILGDGIAGYFIDADGREESWGYTDGASSIYGLRTFVEVTDPYELINPNSKVAVLLDDGVASSGEAIAIAFIGRENTRSFGAPTCGLSTANSAFSLSHDMRLVLTTAYMADRNKVKYGTSIDPDMESNNQEIIQNAVDFISN